MNVAFQVSLVVIAQDDIIGRGLVHVCLTRKASWDSCYSKSGTPPPLPQMGELLHMVGA